MKMKFFTTAALVLLFFSIGNAQNSHTINAGNFYYSPEEITIAPGDTVHWINDGGFHNVNFNINTITEVSFDNPESFESAATSDVEMYTHVFDIVGTYNYDCSVGQHAANGMVGVIIVEETSTSVFNQNHFINSFSAFYSENTEAIEIHFESDEYRSDVDISLFNMEGKLLTTRKIEVKTGSGLESIKFDNSLPGGVYFVSISSESFAKSAKVILP